MHTDQLSQTFLRQISFQARIAHSLADQSQNLFIRHSPSWKRYVPLLMAVTNIITREIRGEGGNIRVEDKLQLITSIWNTPPILYDILKFKRENRSDVEIMSAVRKLVQTEALDVIECKTELDKVFLSLHIISNVKLDYKRPVKLNCLRSFAGVKYFIPYFGGESEPFMHVLADQGIWLLWLPAWDEPTDLAAAAKKWLDDERKAYEYFRFTNVLQLRCVLKAGSEEQVLFEAASWSPPKPAPNSEFLAMAQGAHNMSGGDWLRLFTNLKPGKGGYYLIDSSGQTNRPVCSCGWGKLDLASVLQFN